MLISHDIAVVRAFCDRVLVMYAGRMVEELAADRLDEAAHPYTRALLAAIPDNDTDRTRPLATLPGQPPSVGELPPGCALRPALRVRHRPLPGRAAGARTRRKRAPRRVLASAGRRPPRAGAADGMTDLSVRGLQVELGEGRSAFNAVDGVDLDVPAGTVVGLVGESGSGKSTLGRAIAGLLPAQSGELLLGGVDFRGARAGRARELRRRVQLVFQDPRSALNPRMSVGEALGEALTADRRMRRGERKAEIKRLLELVALEPAYAGVRPRELSGGERQRVALARALAARPDLIVADEVTSALDASIQASILNLLRDVREETGLSMVLISHNIAVVRYMAESIAVMQLGRIVERAATDDLLQAPRHPYTKLLMDSVSLDGYADGTEPLRDPPDPLEPPSGCRFRTVCPVGPEVDPERLICIEQDPAGGAADRPHHAACHFSS